MPGEQVIHLSVVRAFGELGEHFVEVVPRFDLTSTAGEHEAIDHRAGARARGRIAKQPVFPAGAKRTNIPLNEVIIDGGMAIFRIAAQVNPLLAGVANGFAKQAFGEDVLGLFVEPSLESGEHRRTVLLSPPVQELRVTLPIPRQGFDFVQPANERERLLGAPVFLGRSLERFVKAASGMGPATEVGHALKRSPREVAVTDRFARKPIRKRRWMMWCALEWTVKQHYRWAAGFGTANGPTPVSTLAR